nr:MAG TPA: 23S rRNA (uracil-5-)-methyltransferase [Caudoviricetes sp.]
MVRGYAVFPIKRPVNPFTACGGCKWKILNFYDIQY